jgi:hypothetical protein
MRGFNGGLQFAKSRLYWHERKTWGAAVKASANDPWQIRDGRGRLIIAHLQFSASLRQNRTLCDLHSLATGIA